MAIGPIGSASVGYNSTSASGSNVSVTVSHTQPAGSRRVLEVTVGYFYDNGSGETVSLAVTYNGTSLTQVRDVRIYYGGGSTDPAGCAKFILKEASLPTDGAHDVVATVTNTATGTGMRDVAIVCRHLGDVEQTTTTRDHDGAGNATAGTGTSTPALTTVSGDLVTDGLWSYKNTRTRGGSQADMGAQVDASDNSDCHTSYLTASGASTTMSWSFDSQEYAHLAVAYIEDTGGDVTAPTLSSPSATATGSTTGSGSVSTDEGNGTLYWVVTTSATGPSAAQVQAGQDHTGAAAADSGNQAVSGTGTQNVSGGFTGLSPSTTYYAHYQHQDAATNDSTVATSSAFVTYGYTVTLLQISSTVG